MTAIRAVLPRVGAGIGLLLAVGLATGCGGLSDLGGGADEAAAEGAGGEQTDVSVGDVDVTVEDDGGGGTVTLGDDDEVSITMGGDELPDWFPAELPLPEEFTVLSATESQDDDGTLYGLIVSTTAAFDDVIATLDEGLAAAGVEVINRDVGEIAGMSSGQYWVVVDGAEWMVMTGDLGSEQETSVTYSTRTD